MSDQPPPEKGTEPPTYTDGASPRAVLQMVRYCASTWEGKARLLGNVRAEDIVRAIDNVLSDQAPGAETAERTAAPADLVQLVRNLQGWAKEEGWQDTDDALAALLAWEPPTVKTPLAQKVTAMTAKIATLAVQMGLNHPNTGAIIDWCDQIDNLLLVSPSSAETAAPVLPKQAVCTCRHDSGCSSICDVCQKKDLAQLTSDFWHPVSASPALREQIQALPQFTQKVFAAATSMQATTIQTVELAAVLSLLSPAQGAQPKEKP